MEDDILQLLSLVAEANRLAAYMNRDSAFELQLKTFTFDSMTGEGVKEGCEWLVQEINAME